MSFPLGSLPLINGTKTSFNTPFTGLKGLIIGNESGLDCDVQMGPSGVRKKLYPGTIDFFEVRLGYQGVVLVNPTLGIQTGLLYPSSYLTFDMVGLNENIDISVFPMNLNRPMTAGTASPQKGFSTALVLTMSAAPANHSGLNIFNPANSGVIARIFSAREKVSDFPAATPKTITGNVFVRTDGTDNNFAVAAKIFPHNVTDTTKPTGSVMHVTGFVDQVIAAPNVFLGTFLISDDEFQFFGPPDCLYLNPGQNFAIDVQSPIASSLLFDMMVWEER